MTGPCRFTTHNQTKYHGRKNRYNVPLQKLLAGAATVLLAATLGSKCCETLVVHKDPTVGVRNQVREVVRILDSQTSCQMKPLLASILTAKSGAAVVRSVSRSVGVKPRRGLLSGAQRVQHAGQGPQVALIK